MENKCEKTIKEKTFLKNNSIAEINSLNRISVISEINQEKEKVSKFCISEKIPKKICFSMNENFLNFVDLTQNDDFSNKMKKTEEIDFTNNDIFSEDVNENLLLEIYNTKSEKYENNNNGKMISQLEDILNIS
jgi:hypothetical protein